MRKRLIRSLRRRGPHSAHRNMRSACGNGAGAGVKLCHMHQKSVVTQSSAKTNFSAMDIVEREISFSLSASNTDLNTEFYPE